MACHGWVLAWAVSAPMAAGISPAGIAQAAMSAMAPRGPPASEERGIELESSVAAGAEVLGSRQLLAQALANLLDNAIKFTPDGGHVRVLLRGSGREPEVIVEDNGPGIPADKREIVLGRRVRLDEARKFPGSGLGLSLVAAVTKLHGARLVLDDAGPGLRVSLKF